MKTVTIKRNSLTYKFAIHWGGWKPHWDECLDICSFRRALIKASFLALLAATLLAGLWITLSALAFHALKDLFGIVESTWLYFVFGPPALVAVMAAIVLSLCGVCYAIKYSFKSARNVISGSKKLDHVMSPVAEVYKSWRDKYCSKIEIIGD